MRRAALPWSPQPVAVVGIIDRVRTVGLPGKGSEGEPQLTCGELTAQTGG